MKEQTKVEAVVASEISGVSAREVGEVEEAADLRARACGLEQEAKALKQQANSILAPFMEKRGITALVFGKGTASYVGGAETQTLDRSLLTNVLMQKFQSAKVVAGILEKSMRHGVKEAYIRWNPKEESE